MARLWIGGTAESWVGSGYQFGSRTLLAAGGPGKEVRFYDAQTGGNQLTDLLDADDNPITHATTTDPIGHWGPVQLPDGVMSAWADAGEDGNRSLVLGRGAEDAASLAAHEVATTDVHGIADTATLATDTDLAGKADLDAGGRLPESQVPTRLTEPELSATFVALPAPPVDGQALVYDAGSDTWVLSDGLRDTGWRDVAGLLLNGWAERLSGRCRLRRVGRVVQFAAYLDGTAATSGVSLNLPTGFTGYDVMVPWSTATGTSSGNGYIQRSSSAITLATAEGKNNIFASMELLTADPWPTTLPGTPA